MYIGVIHHIQDKDLWSKNLAEYDDSTLQGYTNPISYVAADTTRCFCLWIGPGIDGLQPWLDAATSGAHNEYWEIDPTAEGTIGIPNQT